MRRKTDSDKTQRAAESDLKQYRKYVRKKLDALTPVFAKASIGDFSTNIDIPDEEDEFLQFYVGIQTMLEVIRDQLSELQELNQNLKTEIQRRKQIEEMLRKKAYDLSRFHTVLSKLITMDLSNLELSLRKIAEIAAKTLRVDRVSIWLFNNDHSAMVCKNLYRLKNKSHSSKEIRIEIKNYSSYFKFMKNPSSLSPQEDSRTAEFDKKYLKPNKISSVMDVPIWTHGKIVGVICHEQQNSSRNWTFEEYDFAVSIAEIIALSLVVSERKQAEEALREKTRELAQSNEELEQFAYIASHDLQEPLRMITTYTQFLSKRYQNQLGKEAEEFMHYITDGTDRMSHLIRDLLHYSRIGKQKQNFELVSSEKVLKQTLEDLRSSILENNVIVHVSKLPIVLANEFQLQQLFQNLISNAIKFRQNKTPIVEISAKIQKKQWLFKIQDNGIGIDPQYFERIFTLFQRLHTRNQYPGTGIGLAICKKVVEQHNGKIWLTSIVGKGSTFYFTLPLLPEEKNAKLRNYSSLDLAAVSLAAENC